MTGTPLPGLGLGDSHTGESPGENEFLHFAVGGHNTIVPFFRLWKGTMAKPIVISGTLGTTRGFWWDWEIGEISFR